MTEQEAEAWAARLTRVWTHDQSLIHVAQFNIDRHGTFFFQGRWENGLHLFAEKDDEGIGVELAQDNLLLLTCYDEIYQETAQQKKEVARFKGLVAQWMPFFRRGCWLSGCDIEATAHEKAEWMQGFSREEIETWNLKM